MINYSGSKSKDFAGQSIKDIKSDNANPLSYQTIKAATFKVDEEDLRTGQIYVTLKPNMRQCHKSCGTCSGYHCNISYKDKMQKRLDFPSFYGPKHYYKFELYGDKEHKLIIYLNLNLNNI